MNGNIPLLTPGQMLMRGFIEPMKLDVRYVAMSMALTESSFVDFVDGKIKVDSDIANRLGTVFQTDPKFWLDLQESYDAQISKKSFWNTKRSSEEE
jgi:addiction module HigA family antidote